MFTRLISAALLALTTVLSPQFIVRVPKFVDWNCGDVATRCVPSEYSTIQAAVNASSSGDTVLVSPGLYLETIAFSGHSGTSGSGNTITVLANGVNTTTCR